MDKSKESASAQFSANNLLSFLRELSKEEMRELEKFVKSPFHNNRAEVTKYFLQLKKFHPSFSHSGFTKESIFTELYPKEKYRDDVMRRLASNLYKLAQDYIAFKMFKENEFEQKKNIAEYFSNKFELNFFKKHIEKTSEYLDSKPFRNTGYYYNRKKIEELKSFYISQSDPTRKKFDNTQKMLDLTWQYVMIVLFFIHDTALSDMRYFNKKYDVSLLEPLLKIYHNKDFPKSAALETSYYSLMLNMPEERQDENFYKLKELLEKNATIFEKDELYAFYISLHNYLFEKGLAPDREVSKLEFEVGVQMLELGLITEGNTITAEWFANVFLKAVKAGEFEYAEKFIKDYKMMLMSKERDNIVNFSYAELLFAKGDYVNSLSYLATVKFNNVWEKLRVNHIYIKIHYEMNNEDLFYYLIDSFKHVLKDEYSVTEYVKKLHSDFNDTAAKLFKHRNEGKYLNLRALKKEVNNMKVAGHKWLLDKIEELEKNK